MLSENTTGGGGGGMYITNGCDILMIKMQRNSWVKTDDTNTQHAYITEFATLLFLQEWMNRGQSSECFHANVLQQDSFSQQMRKI